MTADRLLTRALFRHSSAHAWKFRWVTSELLAGWRATPCRCLSGWRGGPVPARGPAGAAVMGAAARVTSRGGDTGQVRPGAAVRDAGWDGRRGAAAESGGDIGGRGKVAVAGELAGRAGQHPPGRFGDPAGTGRAGGGGTALVDQDQADPRRLGLVFECGDQVADA